MTEAKRETRNENREGEKPTESEPAYTDGALYVAQQVYDSLRANECPCIEGVMVCDLQTPQHTAALQHAVMVDGVTVEQLAAAMGSGPKLQALISSTNPYRGVVFRSFGE